MIFFYYLNYYWEFVWDIFTRFGNLLESLKFGLNWPEDVLSLITLLSFTLKFKLTFFFFLLWFWNYCKTLVDFYKQYIYDNLFDNILHKERILDIDLRIWCKTKTCGIQRNKSCKLDASSSFWIANSSYILNYFATFLWFFNFNFNIKVDVIWTISLLKSAGSTSAKKSGSFIFVIL